MDYRFFETVYGLSLIDDLLTIVKISQEIKGCSSEKIAGIADFCQLSDSELRRQSIPEIPGNATVIVSLPIKKLLLRTVPFQGPASQLKDSLREQLSTLFPFKADELAFDVYPLGDGAQTNEYLLTAVKQEVRLDILRRLALLDIKPRQIIIDPLAFINCINSELAGQIVAHDSANQVWCCKFQKDTLQFAGTMRDSRELAAYIAENTPDTLVADVSAEDVAKGAALWHLDGNDTPFTLLDDPPPIPGPLRLFKILTVITFFCLLIFLYSNWQAKQRALQHVGAEITKLTAQVDSTLKIRSDLDRLKKQVELINGMYAGQPSKVRILLEMSRILPKKTWLSSLTIKGDDFILTGEAETASDILVILDNSPLFSNIQLKAPVVKSESGREMFRIAGSIQSRKKNHR